MLTFKPTKIGHIHCIDHYWNEQYQNNILLFKQTIHKINYLKVLVCKRTYYTLFNHLFSL